MKATDQIYPFLDFNATGYGDSIAVDTPLGRQWFPFNRGMDLRTYLAGQAMQGIYAGVMSSMKSYVALEEGAKAAGYSNPATYIAYQAVVAADKLIIELNKEQK